MVPQVGIYISVIGPRIYNIQHGTSCIDFTLGSRYVNMVLIGVMSESSFKIFPLSLYFLQSMRGMRKRRNNELKHWWNHLSL